MALPDKVEAVKNVTETANNKSVNPIEELERVSPNKEHFQSLISSSQPINPTSFERVDPKAFAQEIQNEERKEINPIFAQENMSAQKNGSATDQEGKRRQQSEEIEEISETRSKDSAQSTTDIEGISSVENTKISSTDPVETIKTQTKDAIDQLEKAKTALSEAKTEIKPSYQTLLRNRLGHIDDNVKIALSKAGVEYTPPKVTPGENSNPIKRFIGLVTNTQDQLNSLFNVSNVLSANTSISPAALLAIQIKVGHVQTQIELFTNLLNKALEATKTIMNVQV